MKNFPTNFGKKNLPQKGKYETKYIFKFLFVYLCEISLKKLLKVPWQVQHFNVE
jgi:hypothetical protein